MTDYDRARALRDEAVADRLRWYKCPPDGYKGRCKEGKSCKKCWLEYLSEENEDDKQRKAQISVK